MLSVVVRDVYTDAERREMRASLKSLLPIDSMIWSPAGVYCFWDPETHDALYVGVSNNLAGRFATHNGLTGRLPRGNKVQEINDWFQTHPRLGYSVILQSAIADDKYEGASSRAEGQLIEGHRIRYGSIPPWNKIGASTEGAAKAGVLTGGWFDMLTGRGDSLMVSRRTIRELDADASAEMKEFDLVIARTPLLVSQVGDGAIRTALARVQDNAEYWGMTQDRCAELAAYLDEPAPHPESI
ncbi:GIY-YIG nuclease family protein [Mycobacterium sp. 050128]|uniref:GIY-YIG nuclease family protein n=1 Tax=Mycobacterium sp. 050128 TaxID=3096112 RepID=UPI002EDAC7D8